MVGWLATIIIPTASDMFRNFIIDTDTDTGILILFYNINYKYIYIYIYQL